MQYETKKIREKIVHIPDQGMKDALRFKLTRLRRDYSQPQSPISVYRQSLGFKKLLMRHVEANGRFFVICDMVHAFHQITREMVSQVYLDFLTSKFNICFVEMAGREVLPIGALTSNWFFESYMAHVVDPLLTSWANDYRVTVTRSSDNFLFTGDKASHVSFSQLQNLFKEVGLTVRFSPQFWRKWDWNNGIRFCGVILLRKFGVGFSVNRIKQMYHRAQKRGPDAMKGLTQLRMDWDR